MEEKTSGIGKTKNFLRQRLLNRKYIFKSQKRKVLRTIDYFEIALPLSYGEDQHDFSEG